MFRLEMESPSPTGWPEGLRVQVTMAPHDPNDPDQPPYDQEFSLLLEGPNSAEAKVHYLCFENNQNYIFAWVFPESIEMAPSGQSSSAFWRRGSDETPDLFSAEETAPEQTLQGSGAKVSAGHVSQVSGSRRNSPPTHRRQSPRTEAPSVPVSILLVLVPLGMVQQRVRLNDEA